MPERERESLNDSSPRTIDEARMQMVEALHIAVYGYTGARPESPAQVWAELLDRVTQARQAFERFGGR